MPRRGISPPNPLSLGGWGVPLTFVGVTTSARRVQGPVGRHKVCSVPYAGSAGERSSPLQVYLDRGEHFCHEDGVFGGEVVVVFSQAHDDEAGLSVEGAGRGVALADL